MFIATFVLGLFVASSFSKQAQAAPQAAPQVLAAISGTPSGQSLTALASSGPLAAPRFELDPQSSKWMKSTKESCSEYFPGKIQVGINRACGVGAQLFKNSQASVVSKASPALAMAQAGCRLQYGEESSETAACLIGTLAAFETALHGSLTPKTSVTAKAFQSCSAIYRVRTELDTYLLESCLTGALAPHFAAKTQKSEDYCSAISPEKSFLGPCRVGASLSPELMQTADGLRIVEKPESETLLAAPEHRAQCEKYFDQLRFHMGYRNCIIGRAVALSLPSTKPSVEALKSACDNSVGDSGNDHERGACMVGSTLAVRANTAPFERCGVAQVSYQDRDFLGCLAAASFLSLSNKNQADEACRTIFRDKRSLVRSSCTASISKLTGPAPESSTATQL